MVVACAYGRLLESLIKSKKRWFDVPNTHSRKMWCVYLF
jgi:hypothetical protein